ncbi:hypothetical protein L0Z72_15610 [candidate division KSB1 bacterium]|nr:hypothetical protein [candidate division KSB1 bacterium]
MRLFSRMDSISELGLFIVPEDRPIDQLVYQLYGLTAEETRMVDGN